MDELGDEKTKDADFGGVVDGEDDVGDKSNEKGEAEQTVGMEITDSVEEAEEDAGDFDGSDDWTGRKKNADENYTEDKKPNPRPRCRENLAKEGAAERGSISHI